MTDYNDGNWHGWNGGECPVHPLTVVECAYTDDRRSISGSAKGFPWACSIFSDGATDRPAAFRVTKEHKEPREFWAKNVAGLGWVQCADNAGETVLFREVIK